METIGNVCEIQGVKTFQWEIKDFLQLQDKLDKGYKSPQISFSAVSWEIMIYPYGEKNNESVGYIGLYLYPMSLPKPVTMNMSFSIKTVDEKSDFETTHTQHFDKDRLGRGWAQFMLRSDLIKRKSELLPSGALTVICTLKDSATNVITVNNCLNAFVHREERTGVWKLQQHLHEIFLNGDVSDVILKVKDQEFKSHRCILAARSPVFSAMMKNEMKENATGIVDIQDIDPKIFSVFLNYLYTGSTEDLTPENVTKLYAAADKYQVQVLKENCLDYMLMNISIENFCDIFSLSIQHTEEKLKETCVRYFGKHLLDILKTCKWQSFLSENPIVCNELHIRHIELNKDMYTSLSEAG